MHNGEFLLEEEYEESKVDLNQLNSATALKEAAQALVKHAKSGNVYEIETDGTTQISNLEEGVYLIRSYESEEVNILPTLVFVPTWMESEGVMLHDVTVVPKSEMRLQTGDNADIRIGALFFTSFLLIFLILFRRKHLRKRKNCDTMQ